MPALDETTIATLCLAPIVGSFLGVVIDRLPAARPIVAARSRCPHCNAILTPRDLVPLASWAATRGTCRHCSAKLSLFYPTIEVAAFLVALSGLLVVPNEAISTLAFSLVLGWSLLALGWIDVRHYLLPDMLTLPLVAAGLLAAWLLTPENFIDHCLGTVAGYLALAIVAAMYRRLRGRAGLGGGDTKLMAAAGAWVSWQGLPSVLLLASVIGIAMHLALAARSRDRRTLQDKLPFGPALAAATWFVWLFGPVETLFASPFT
jgi:leader peptidase (prepilin peptidase)/N-methyltransferase